MHDSPLVLNDPVAVAILGDSHSEDLRRTPLRSDRPYSTGLRAFVVARSRFAEDNLARAVQHGVTQYVLLGAGLDTFAYRNPYPHLHVFEVDHPATQEWKRSLLRASQIAIPENVTYTPVDFENQSLASQLAATGWRADQPAFFAWLGVVPYLSRNAFRATLHFIAGRPPGSGLTLDYAQPREVLPYFEQLALDSLASRVAQAGEPFQLFFTPDAIASELHAFGTIEDLGVNEINERYFARRSDPLSVRGSAGRLLSAWV